MTAVVWEPEGAYWREPRILNAWDQPGIVEVGLDVTTEGRLGVAVDTFMCETFLRPEDALEFARRVRRTALHALRAEKRRREAVGHGG